MLASVTITAELLDFASRFPLNTVVLLRYDSLVIRCFHSSSLFALLIIIDLVDCNNCFRCSTQATADSHRGGHISKWFWSVLAGFRLALFARSIEHMRIMLHSAMKRRAFGMTSISLACSAGSMHILRMCLENLQTKSNFPSLSVQPYSKNTLFVITSFRTIVRGGSGERLLVR